MTTGVDQSLVDYADACNERAKALGIELRLYEVDLDADEFLFVCAAPKALRQLVKRGYLGVEER